MVHHADPTRRCLTLQEWPARDRAAFETAFVRGDLFDDAGAATKWSERTEAKIRAGYGRWLYWLEDQHLLDPEGEPGALVTRECVKRYLDDLTVINAPFTIYCRAQELHM